MFQHVQSHPCSHENSLTKNVRYCAKEINRKCFYLPLTRLMFYEMMPLPRLRHSRDFSPYSYSAELADEDASQCVMIIISTKNKPQGFYLIHWEKLKETNCCGSRPALVALRYGVNKTRADTVSVSVSFSYRK